MPDIRELGQRVKRKYPGAYDNIDDAELGRRVKAKYPGAYDQFTDAPAPPPQGVFESFQTGVAGPLLRNVVETAADLYNRPLETLERAGRGALEFVSAISTDPAATGVVPHAPTLPSQSARLAELRRRAEAERPENVRLMERGMQVEEAGPRTRAGRIAFGAGKVLGEVAFPTAPESALPNIAMAPAGGAAVGAGKQALRAVTGAVRRALGRGIEAGAGAAPRFAESMVQSRWPRGMQAPLQRMPDEPLGTVTGMAAAPLEATASRSLGEAAQMALPGMEGMLEASIAQAAQRSPWQDTVLAYYRANLLTNPFGRAADLGSTLINQFADAAARPIAAAVDVVVSKLTGRRAVTGPSLRGAGQAFGSMRQGFRDVGKVLKTGEQAIESGADDVVYGAEIRSGLGKVVDVPVNGVFRLLGALDAPFRRFGFARNLYDRARVAAINERKRGLIQWDELTARTRQLLDDEDIIKAAVRDGEAAVLSEPNRISSWLASQTAASPNARLAIGIVQPFMRIPLNAVLKAADFSGIGGVKAMYKIARGVGRKARGQRFFRDIEDQRVFSQNVAAGSFAPAAFILGMELEERGKMNGYFYTSKRDFPDGRVPTSVNIGGENYDINRLGGFIAAPLFIGATYNRLRKQDVGKADAFLRSFSGLVQTAPSLGYYGVPAKAGRLLTADEPGNVLLQEAGGTVSGFIPASGALGYAAKAIDPEKRREAEGFTGPIMSRIPGLRQRLPVKEARRQKRGRR